MNVAFLLHLYQPPTQSESVFRLIYNVTYFPLLKLAKNNPDYRFTLNLPLSLLEQMEKYGYTEWIKEIHDLYENDRIEIVGSAAYHPLLTKIPDKIISEQIILNEYGLGYYFGSKQGFEGEPSILIKDIKGFFPPELALNENVLSVINSLGYEWVIADKCAIPELGESVFTDNIFKYKDISTNIVVRDCDISNSLSFKRDSNIEDIVEKIQKKRQLNDGLVVALDGEAFGHHNPEGIYVLDSLMEKLLQLGINITTVDEMVDACTKDKSDTIIESNWSEIVCSTEPAKLYKLWDNKDNKLQQDLWDIQKMVVFKYIDFPELQEVLGMENIPLWHINPSPALGSEINKRIELNNIVNKSLHSDQFWWASGESLYDKVLFSPDMILGALNIYKEISVRMGDQDLIKYISEKSADIENRISKKE